MNCPHCKQNLTYKRRTNRRCTECRREFAFEPKGHPLALHDNRFGHMLEKLSDGGSFFFTADQLRYALARKPVAAQKRTDAGCLAAPFVVAAVGLGALVAETVAPAAGYTLAAAIGLAGVLTFTKQRRAPFHPTMPMGPEQFRTQVLARWVEIYGEGSLEKLVDPARLAPPPDNPRLAEGLCAVVVSPERDVLACLLANEVPKQLGVGLLPAGPPFEAWQQVVLDRLRSEPDLPVLLLHDASAAGAFLARDLPLLLRLDPRHRVYDLGLNPKRSILRHRLVLGAPLSETMLARLGAELTQVSETARPIRRGRARMTPEEIAWLADGFSSPILAISPASLVKRVRFALEKIESKRKTRRPGESVGFLTWPAA